MFAQADIFLLPSEEEGSPHSLLEAMTAGVPFVAFNVGGVYEHVPPTCVSYAVPENDVDAFVAGVRKLLSSPEVYESFRGAEKEFVLRFRKDVILKKFAEKIL